MTAARFYATFAACYARHERKAVKASDTLMVIAAGALGAALGLGSYTFAYAKGWAYLTNDPRACANCHVMNEQYDGWIKSSHRAAAVCNDCHVPHAFIGK